MIFWICVEKVNISIYDVSSLHDDPRVGDDRNCVMRIIHKYNEFHIHGPIGEILIIHAKGCRGLFTIKTSSKTSFKHERLHDMFDCRKGDRASLMRMIQEITSVSYTIHEGIITLDKTHETFFNELDKFIEDYTNNLL